MHDSWGQTNCRHNEDVSVSCSSPIKGYNEVLFMIYQNLIFTHFYLLFRFNNKVMKTKILLYIDIFNNKYKFLIQILPLGSTKEEKYLPNTICKRTKKY
jgi:hypothetical protein